MYFINLYTQIQMQTDCGQLTKCILFVFCFCWLFFLCVSARLHLRCQRNGMECTADEGVEITTTNLWLCGESNIFNWPLLAGSGGGGGGEASTVVCRIIANRINDWSWLNDLLAVGRTMPLGFHPEAPCRNEATPVRLKSSGEKKIQTIAFTAIFMHEFHAISKCTHHTHTNTENKYKPTPRALAGHSLLLCSALRRTVQTNARIPLQSPHSPPSIRCYFGATWFSLPAPFPSYWISRKK